MSSVNSKLAQALVPLLTVSLLAMGCDDSTGPSKGDDAVKAAPTSEVSGEAGTGGPASHADRARDSSRAPDPRAHARTRPTRAPDSTVVTPVGGGFNAVSALSAALVQYGSRAYCEGTWNDPVIRVPMMAGLPFQSTGSGSRQLVWFRVNFWSQPRGGTARWIGSSNWFYTYLSPGQQSTTVWYKYPTGQTAAWQVTMPSPAVDFTDTWADAEYEWQQDNRVLTHYTRRSYHMGGKIAFTGFNNAFCRWGPIV